MATLQERMAAINARLTAHGLTEDLLEDSTSLDAAEYSLQPAEAVAEQIVILDALAYAATYPDERGDIADWLEVIGLWDKMEESDRLFLESEEQLEEEDLLAYQWGAEGAYMLAWALGKTERPEPTEESNMDTLYEELPEPGDEISEFVKKAKLRPIEDIIDEFTFNDAATRYFERAFGDGGEDAESGTEIDPFVVLERGNALAWALGMDFSEEDDFISNGVDEFDFDEDEDEEDDK